MPGVSSVPLSAEAGEAVLNKCYFNAILLFKLLQRTFIQLLRTRLSIILYFLNSPISPDVPSPPPVTLELVVASGPLHRLLCASSLTLVPLVFQTDLHLTDTNSR